MGYTPNSTWQDSPSTATPLSAARLQNIESGLDAAADVADAAYALATAGGGGLQLINNQTGTTYTFVAGDAGKLVTCNNAAPVQFTIPLDADATIAIGSYVDLLQKGAGKLTVVGAGSAITTKFLTLPGSSGNYASTPSDAVWLQGAGDFELTWREKMTDRTPAAEKILFARWGDAGSRSFSIHWLTNGAFYYQFSADGTATTGVIQSGGNPSLSDGTWYWFRMRYTYATRSWALVYAVDQTTEPTSWTTYSSSGTAAQASMYTGGSQPIEVGSLGNGTYANFIGNISHLHFRKSHGGANSGSLSPENWTTGTTWVSATGQTFTLQGSASIGSEEAGGGGSALTIYTSGLTNSARAQGSRMGAQKVAASTWSIFGDLASV